MDDSVVREEGMQSQFVSYLEEMDSADTPCCSNGESATLVADTRVKELTLMNVSLHKLNELATGPQRSHKDWMCVY